MVPSPACSVATAKKEQKKGHSSALQLKQAAVPNHELPRVLNVHVHYSDVLL
jgi:hypothetical protein